MVLAIVQPLLLTVEAAEFAKLGSLLASQEMLS